jgi:hypothetical protein
MLVTANVLRLRRQWALAEAKCSEVLQFDPGSATAYSILGSIARDQGKLRDAIEWYRMALDRDPASVSDRRMLEEVIDRVFSGQDKRLTERARAAVKGGLDSVAAQASVAGKSSPMPLLLRAVLAVVVLGAVAVLVSLRGCELRPPAATTEPPTGGFVAAPTAGAPMAPTHPRAAVSVRPVPPQFDEGVAVLEAELLAYLCEHARVTDPDCEVVAVEIDPRDGAASLRLVMPRRWLPESMRRSVLRASLELAAAAAGYDERISIIRVRCDMRQDGLPDRAALIAEGSARLLANARSDGRLKGEWGSVWWHPELAGAEADSAAPGGG